MAVIRTNVGNLLDVESGVLVHGCNALGVMGAGVALAIRKRFPNVYAAYLNRTRARPWSLGEVQFVPVRQRAGRPSLVVANAITQAGIARRAGERVVDYDAVQRAFEFVGRYAAAHALSVHFPLIGCGLAGGQWGEVRSRIEAALPAEVEANLWVLSVPELMAALAPSGTHGGRFVAEEGCPVGT